MPFAATKVFCQIKKSRCENFVLIVKHHICFLFLRSHTYLQTEFVSNHVMMSCARAPHIVVQLACDRLRGEASRWDSHQELERQVCVKVYNIYAY